jgi:hypothetical protein
VLARAARAIASDSSVWCTTTGNIADWWRARAAVTARVDTSSSGRVLVTVRNGGRSAIRSLVVHVRDVTARVPLRSDARLLAAPAGELRLLVPSLTAGATRTYTVVYAAPPAPLVSPRRPAPHVIHRAPRKHWSWRQLFPWSR